MTVRDAMMHMTGLGWGGRRAVRDGDVTARRRSRAGWLPRRRIRSTRTGPCETIMERLAERPLRYHPGDAWIYSVSTDVCARLVEIISGQRFDEYLNDEIFEPLGMKDTGFMVPDEKIDRFAANYGRGRDKTLKLIEDPVQSGYRKPGFCRAAAASLAPRPTTCASRRCCATAASSTARASSAARPSS